MALNPPSLLELAARTVRTSAIEYGPQDVPMTLVEYLRSANCCVNPKCRGVFFDNRVEHIKFVDFCGKYRVPLMQYLCSSKCIEPTPSSSHSEPGASGYMMRKVLLGWGKVVNTFRFVINSICFLLTLLLRIAQYNKVTLRTGDLFKTFSTSLQILSLYLPRKIEVNIFLRIKDFVSWLWCAALDLCDICASKRLHQIDRLVGEDGDTE